MTRTNRPLLPIFLIVFVDALGFSIVLPLLALYAEDLGATPLEATMLSSVFAVCSLISTPVIGNLSDRYGRRPLLLVSQIGTCAGFIVLGTATSLWMVFVGRILDGITAGNMATAQAYISDHTEPEERAKAFGLIGVAFGVGLVFGPILGGWLGDHSLHLPFLVAAGLSTFSITCSYTLLPREAPPEAAAERRRPNPFAVSLYAEYFRRPLLASLYLRLWLLNFALAAFASGFALFAEQRFGWSAKQTGYVFTYAGVLGIVFQGGLVGRLVKRFGETRLALAGFAAGAAGYALLGFADAIVVLVIATTLASFANSVVRPVLLSQLTKAVGRHEQGIAMGINGSLISLALTISPLAGGAMLDYRWTLGWALVSACATAIGLVVTIAARPARGASHA